MRKLTRPSDVELALIRKSGSTDRLEALAAQREIAKAVTEPLRQGILVGDILNGIFEVIQLEPGTTPEWPLDLLAPGEEDEHVAYTNPGHGRIPERQVEGDYVMIPTYMLASSIDFLLRYAREARWDVVGRALQVLEAGFVKKINDDGWHTLLAAGVDRNILVFDGDSTQGQFTKRLISLMKTIMRRNGGGNSTSLKRSVLTDAYTSPEAIEDVRNWGVDQVDETTRREIFVSSDDGPAVTRIFGINLHDLDELGESQEYQNFFTAELGGSLGSDVELVVGLDNSGTHSSFIMPVKLPVEIFEDETMHRQQKQGYYGTAEVGFGALDNRNIILASF